MRGVTADEFRPLDKAVELQHVVKQPGFISRESAAGDNDEWLVVVHWRSVADAEASMASFPSAPARAQQDDEHEALHDQMTQTQEIA